MWLAEQWPIPTVHLPRVRRARNSEIENQIATDNTFSTAVKRDLGNFSGAVPVQATPAGGRRGAAGGENRLFSAALLPKRLRAAGY